jgi:hypothetical protein
MLAWIMNLNFAASGVTVAEADSFLLRWMKR